MTWEPEEFDELAAELRRRVGAEFREEAEEVERLALLQRRRRAGMREVAEMAMHRGDQVTIRGGGREWTGGLVTVGEDYLGLRAPGALVEARLNHIALAVHPARAGGQSARPLSTTLRARLAEFEQTGETITLITSGPDLEETGVIEVVATDHIDFLTSAARIYLPLAAVTFVVRPVLR